MSGATFGRRSQSAGRPQTIERARTTWRGSSDAAPRQQTSAVRQPQPSTAVGGELSADAQRFLTTGQPPSWVTTTRGGLIAGALILGAVLLALVYGYGANVLRDHRLAGTWRPALDVKISEAKCTSYWFVLSTCSVNYSWTEHGATRVSEANFMVSLKSTNGTPVLPVRSTRDPSVVTAYVAANDWLTNRTVSLVVFSLLLALAVLGCLKGLVTGRYKDGPAYDNLVAELRAVGAAMQARETTTKAAG